MQPAACKACGREDIAMKLVALLIAATLFAAPAAIARQPRGGSPAPADCPLTIGYSSYGAGIDRSFDAVERLLAGDRAVRAVTRHGWGREGETTLCVRTRSGADAARLFHAARRLIPARPRGPVSLSTQGGLRYQSPPPQRR
jgi:hypothetical protein